MTEVSRRRVSYLGRRWRGLRGVRLACFGREGFEDDAVDDGFDGVVFALFEAHALGELGHLAVDAGAEALLVEGFELFAELAFAAADDGGVDGDALAGGEGGDALDDLLGGLAGDGAVAVGAVGLADGGVEQAEVVVDLGDGADGGAGAAGGGLLLDGDGGGEAVDGVDVGALHLVEELAGVGGEGFDVAALAFGVDGVEGEGGLAGAGEAGDHGEGVARDADVDVTQIVLARAADGDVSNAHEMSVAVFGQVSRIRHFEREGFAGRDRRLGPRQPRNGKDVSEGAITATFGPL